MGPNKQIMTRIGEVKDAYNKQIKNPEDNLNQCIEYNKEFQKTYYT